MPKDGRAFGIAKLYHRRIAIEAAKVAGEALNVAPADVLSRRRARSTVAFARQLSMYLAHVVGGMSLAQIAEEFERDRTTVGYACHAIEDRRDSPIFDDQVDLMERRLKARLTDILIGDV